MVGEGQRASCSPWKSGSEKVFLSGSPSRGSCCSQVTSLCGKPGSSELLTCPVTSPQTLDIQTWGATELAFAPTYLTVEAPLKWPAPQVLLGVLEPKVPYGSTCLCAMWCPQGCPLLCPV